jgi:hypothetical protein
MTELDTADSLRFQRRAWAFERVGWVAMALFLVCATAGVLGRGPFSHAQGRSHDGMLSVDYERVVRRSAPSDLRLMIDVPRPNPCVVRLSRAYVDQAGVEQIVPPAQSIQSAGDELLYRFPTTADDGPLTIQIRMSMRAAGIVNGSIRVGDEAVGIRQIVLP